MYIGTHACIPLVIASAIDIVRLRNHKDKLLSNTQYLLLALAGVLPDFLWPHFSMHQRLTSWTHTIWFLAVLFPAVFFFSKWRFGKDALKFTVIFWMAAVLHIFMDGISGGVPLYYPFGNVVGKRYISHGAWLKWDIVLMSVTMLLLFLRYIAAKSRYQARSS